MVARTRSRQVRANLRRPRDRLQLPAPSYRPHVGANRAARRPPRQAACGHRRLGSPPDLRTGAPARRASEGRAALERRPAERRQITAMFCDLVDSTRLAATLDPEDFGSVMQAYQQACETITERYGGHVSQYRGDGVEIYFGWPAAHEDAAERAVRAGLDVVEAVKALAAPQALSVRVGISTGMVMVGEAAFGDPSIPSAAVGEALHVAARLQALAAPSTVVISEATRRLVSARFDQDDLGSQNSRAWRLRFPRFDSARSRGYQPLPGRARRRVDAAGRTAHGARFPPATLARRQGRARGRPYIFRAWPESGSRASSTSSGRA